MMNTTFLTVSQINRYVHAKLEEERNLHNIYVRGEIIDISYNSRSGHLYFTISDETASLKCVMFSSNVSKLKQIPETGTITVLCGDITLYEKTGSYQIVVYDLQTIGIGFESESYKKLKEKLEKEGLFCDENKKRIPLFPKKIGVITSSNGAALFDIISTMKYRNPLIELNIFPVNVQGITSINQIIESLDYIENNSQLCDVVIITRGGGASEDLSCFNDEELIRRVSKFSIPLISAVGHEIDYTLLDYVADARAATPTAACITACQDINHIILQISQYQQIIEHYSPYKRIESLREKIESYNKILNKSIDNHLQHNRIELQQIIDKLNLLNPTTILNKGYSITLNEDGSKLDKHSVHVGNRILTRLSNCLIKSNIYDVEEKKDIENE